MRLLIVVVVVLVLGYKFIISVLFWVKMVVVVIVMMNCKINGRVIFGFEVSKGEESEKLYFVMVNMNKMMRY